MIVIGITGQTGAGKTTALHELEKMGGASIDCDAVYHGLLVDNTAMQIELQHRFGDILTEDSGVDRKKLGAIVFQDKIALADLNSITHCYVIAAVTSKLAEFRCNGKTLACIDAIGLFESGLDKICHSTVAITAPVAMRIQRIMARENITKAYAEARVNAQNVEAFYTEQCTHSIINAGGSVAKFAEEIHTLFVWILSNHTD